MNSTRLFILGALARGRLELTAIRDQALRQTKLRPDPVDLALQNPQDMSEEELRAAPGTRKL